MDRRIKERLIGATILVALIVLIVPELLSGPKPAPLPPLAAGLPPSTRNVSVNLATSKATPELQAADAAAAAAGETPAAGAANAVAANAVAANAVAANAGAASTSTITTLRAQESAAPPLETSVSSPKSGAESTRAAASSEVLAQGRRGWAVQLGSFASRANAEKLLHQLPGSGFYVISSGSGPSLRYRVRMGPLADRSAAARAVTKLKAEGHAATIVTPAS